MDYDLPVAQMARGDDIEGFYVLKSAFSKVANNGKPFLNLTLSDRTGAVDAKVWDYPGPIGAADEGVEALKAWYQSQYEKFLAAHEA